MKSFPMKDSRVLVGYILGKIREKYGSRVSINIYDPRCYLWFFDLVRFNVRATEATWVMDGKLLARGVPSWEDLEISIDERLEKE